MPRRGLVIKYEDIAAYLAHEDADIQGKFFTVFAKELKDCCDTAFHTLSQLAAIRETLSPETREWMGALGE